MPFLVDKYESIKQQLSLQNVTLVAVSKTKPAEDILEAYRAGQKDFGENYVQELVTKYEALPKDIQWHFIGHLQSNKVKFIAPFVHLIHGVDTEKLLMEINKQGEKLNRRIPCLLQVYISKEETKFGFDDHELEAIISKTATDPQLFKYVSLQGLMGMATFTEDNALLEKEFAYLKSLFDKYAQRPTLNDQFTTLSMGMSADYSFAIAAGSNMVRIGSLLFGEKNHPQ